MTTDLTPFADPRPNQEEAQMSLTGLEESMIARRFGTPVGKLLKDQPFQGLRACAYAELRRGNAMSDKDAYDYAIGLTIAEVLKVYPQVPGGDDEGKEQ